MSRADRARDDRFAVPWSLPNDHPEPHGEPTVIDLSRSRCVMDHEAHCPACGSRRMQSIVTDEAGRYDRCLDCERLWVVQHDRLELALGARVTSGER